MAVAAVADPKKAAAKNLVIVKTALRRASKKGVRVGFAFAPGKDKRSHILMIDPRKNAKTLMAELKKLHADRRQLCCGTATVVDENGKKTLSIVYVKKLTGAERKMQDALKIMTLRYAVKLETDEEDEDIEERAEDDTDADDEAADDSDDEAADDTDDEADDEADDDTEDDEDEEETEDDDAEAAADSEDDDRGSADADESEPDEAHPAGVEDEAPSAPAISATKLAAIGAAPQIWSQTQAVMSANVDKLKTSIKAEYAGESAELIADIENSLAQIDQVVARFDQTLAQQLQKAHQAADEATRKAELAKAKAIVAAHIKYVASEPLIAHIDSNPFGVDTNLKKVLTASLTHMAKVIS